MDKKKVKELIEKTIRFTKATDDDYIHGKVKSHIINTLHVALEELSKSDWVSVEDGLPEFNKEVLVTSKENPNGIWLSYRPSEKCPVMDKNGFSCPSYFNITHWKPIEKLEE